MRRFVPISEGMAGGCASLWRPWSPSVGFPFFENIASTFRNDAGPNGNDRHG
jgi:hypothetical protein